MAIYKLIANRSFDPDQIDVMSTAYERVLLELDLMDRDDSLTDTVAASIVAVAATGERDPQRLMERALQALGVKHRKPGKKHRCASYNLPS